MTTSPDDEQRDRSLARLAAKARILESLVGGDARVLAVELREGLEALCEPGAQVIHLGRRRV